MNAEEKKEFLKKKKVEIKEQAEKAKVLQAEKEPEYLEA